MLFHSLWQSALILFVYVTINFFIRDIHPLQRRNFLFFFITAQIVISSVTFILFFNGSTLVVASQTIQTLYASISGFSLLEKNAELIFYSYLAIILFRAFAICNQCLTFKRNCLKDLVKPSAKLKIFTDLKAYQLGIKKKVILRYSHRISVPFTFGFFKPFILLPFSLVNQLSTAEAESIILHELSHIKDHDYLLNRIVIFAENFYFFNPFFQLIIVKLKTEREKSCDVQVLNFNYCPIEYAETLLKTARFGTGAEIFEPAFVGKKTELLKRIHFFSKEQNLIFKKNHSNVFLISGIVFYILVNIFLLPIFNKKETGRKDYNLHSPFAVKAGISNFKEHSLFIPANQPKTISVNNKKKIRNIQIHKQPSPSTEKFSDTETDFIPIPANYNQTPDSTKEFIYNEETQAGKIIQSFKLVLINGNWIMQPQWMILETNPDSSRKVFRDTLQYKNIPL